LCVTTEPLRSVRDHLSELVDRVEREHDRVVITRTGREAAVLIRAADLAELEETLSVLSDAQALADIREAESTYARGDVIRGVDAVRALRS
jgi:antitoxin YefM